jgi:hypothetical protein
MSKQLFVVASTAYDDENVMFSTAKEAIDAAYDGDSIEVYDFVKKGKVSIKEVKSVKYS